MVSKRARSSGWGERLELWSHPAVQVSQSRRRARVALGEAESRLASNIEAPRKCIRAGRQQVGQGKEVSSDSGQ